MYNRGLKGWMKHLDFMILDLIIIEISFILAYSIRHPGQSIFDNEVYRSVFFVLALSEVMAALLLRVHSGILRRGYLKEFISVMQLILFTAAVIMAYMFFGKTSEKYSRLVVFYYILLASVLVYISRILWKKLIDNAGKGAAGRIRHMFLITTSDIAEEVIDTINRNSFGTIEITGMALADAEYKPAADISLISNEDTKAGTVPEIKGVKIVTTMDGAADYISRQWVDEVMIDLPPEYETPQELLRECYLMGVTTHVALKYDVDRYSAYEAGKVAGIYTLTESVRIVDGYDIVIKRLMDIAGSIVGLIFTILLTVIIGPLIFIADPGPIFYSQERVGKNGRIFKMHKFRSMYKDADREKDKYIKDNGMQGFIFKMDDDPRIIGSGSDGKKHGIGWFIRRTSIDEFPQFLNVFSGEMSLVGTRPPTVDEWEKYERRHRARLAMKPGITGLWQISGRNEITNFDEIVDMDMEYINTWTISEDIKIILKTVGAVITGRGAK